MRRLKRWTSAALACALALSLSIASSLAVPAAEPFASFLIDAAQMDAPDRTLTIDLYQRDEAGSFQFTDSQDYDCKVNQVTNDASFYIQPKVDGVRVTVDYLTGLDGSAAYELLDGGSAPVWDSLNAQGELVQGGFDTLDSGQTYILSAETLAERFDQTAASRARSWDMEDYQQNFPLCRVTLSCTNPEDGLTYEQLYYLEIFGDILLPCDVSRNSPYCGAIEYCLSKGWLTGYDDGSFGPDEPLNRAQLAQVLWTMGGCQMAEQADFLDVSSSDWFCQAVSWCRLEGLIAGYEDGIFLPYAPLSREQLATLLYRYARYTGSNPFSIGDLSQYADHESVSSWAYDSMRWAVSNHLLTTANNTLSPGNTITRAELAFALHAYQGGQNLRSIL